MADQTPLQELTDLTNLDPRRIQQLVVEGVLPRPKRKGAYDVRACVQCYCRYLQDLLFRNGNAPAEGEAMGEIDPDTLTLDDQKKYWEVVNLRQKSAEHDADLLREAEGEALRRLSETMAPLRDALAQCGLTDGQLAAVNAAFVEANNALR